MKGPKVFICKCSQCRGKKRNMRGRKAVKRIKRMISKKRRTLKEGHAFNWYWS